MNPVMGFGSPYGFGGMTSGLYGGVGTFGNYPRIEGSNEDFMASLGAVKSTPVTVNELTAGEHVIDQAKHQSMKNGALIGVPTGAGAGAITTGAGMALAMSKGAKIGRVAGGLGMAIGILVGALVGAGVGGFGGEKFGSYTATNADARDDGKLNGSIGGHGPSSDHHAPAPSH